MSASRPTRISPSQPAAPDELALATVAVLALVLLAGSLLIAFLPWAAGR